MSASSGCNIGVVRARCWCRQDVVLVRLLAIRMQCQCHWGAVLVLLGRGVGVEIVDAQGPSVSATAHSTPPPSRRAPPEHPQATPKVREGCRPLHQQRVTQCPAPPSPLLLLRCHLMRVEGMMTAALLMQKTSRRVPDADTAKSSDMVRAHLDVWGGRLGERGSCVGYRCCQEAVGKEKEGPLWLFVCGCKACLLAILKMSMRCDTIW